LRALRRHLLPLTVFLTGASVLIVEVLATRVLSPFYGNTIFTVSSVISVILLALSVGYWAGGVLADRRPSLETFFTIIFASGVLLLVFHVLGGVVLPSLSAMFSLAVGPLVSSAVLFLLPALLLGTVSPYAVKLQSLSAPEQGVGRVAGTIFFWSTLGSISGSLLAGFVLIPTFGIDRILTSTAVALAVLGLVPLIVLRASRARVTTSVMALAIAVVGGAWVQARFAPQLFGLDPADVVYSKDGVYQKITIYEGEYYGRPARFLLLDRSESGAMFLDADDPSELVYDYTKYHALYKIFAPRVARALMLGGGAYSIPKALLRELPDAEIDVAEIEPSLFELSTRYFRLPASPRLHNLVDDGRRFLQQSRGGYDVIFGDVYYSYYSVPPQFTTREFFALARARLATGGVFIANMIGDLSRRQPSLIMAEIRTFQEVFPNSYFFAVDAPEKTNLIQNVTLVGYAGKRVIDVTAAPVTTDRDPLIRFLRYKQLDVARRFELSAYPVLTDRFSPVEYLTARVLQRSLTASMDVDGEEIRALRDQQLRYGHDAQHRVRDLLVAEMGLMAQELDVGQTSVTGRLFADEPRRIRLTAHYARSPAAVAVLLEVMRTVIGSAVPPPSGVDFVFDAEPPRQPSEATGKPSRTDAPASPETPPTVVAVDEKYRDRLNDPDADDLERIGRELLDMVYARR